MLNNSILVRSFPKPHKPFKPRHVPLLARFYCYAYQTYTNSRAEIWLMRALRKVFRAYRRICGASFGEFDYQRIGKLAKIKFNARNTQFHTIYDSNCKNNGYELEVAALLDALLPEGGTFFDVGSNWGYFVLYSASNHERLRIFAFEPTPGTYNDLVRCVKEAGLSDLVVCMNIALSNVDGDAFIQIPDGLHSGCAEVSKTTGSAGIKTRRLDSLGLPPPDFIKIDVENHELEVLQGAEHTLRTARPFLVFESKPPDYRHPEKILTTLFLLSKLGYRLYVPGTKRQFQTESYMVQSSWHRVGHEDQFALVPFSPETRLLWQHDINVFACHESRGQELLNVFDVWP